MSTRPLFSLSSVLCLLFLWSGLFLACTDRRVTDPKQGTGQLLLRLDRPDTLAARYDSLIVLLHPDGGLLRRAAFALQDSAAVWRFDDLPTGPYQVQATLTARPSSADDPAPLYRGTAPVALARDRVAALTIPLEPIAAHLPRVEGAGAFAGSSRPLFRGGPPGGQFPPHIFYPHLQPGESIPAAAGHL